MTLGCQQNLLSPTAEDRAILEYLCQESHKVYNCALYYARQLFFKTKRFANRAELCSEMVKTKNKHFGAMYVSSAQQTCNAVAEAFKSFKSLQKLWRSGKLESNPAPPKYRKQGLYPVSYPIRWLKLTNGKIRIPLGTQVKVWFGIGAIYLPMPTNLNWHSLKELRILPRNGCFYAEFIYQQQQPPSVALNPTNALGIDHGINNWLTCVIDGRKLKSKNQWYNKRVATLKEGQRQGFWSKQLAAITEKRNRQVGDAVNKAARLIINHCLHHQIGTIVFGWNQGQKKQANMGSKTNQQFVQIPTARLKERVSQLCEQCGIRFFETEEAYSSAASFLDNDSVPKYGEKPVGEASPTGLGWKASGRRVERGLYRTAGNWYVNADCNAAANILRKVAAILGLDLSGVSRGVLTAPLKVRLWAVQESPSL